MSKLVDFGNGLGNVLMIVCFVVALSVAVATVCLMIVDNTWDAVGVGVGTTGIWMALWLFVMTRREQRKVDARVCEGLCEILERLKKCQCSCQADAAGGCECQPSS